jgi:hypothetical protein
MYAGSIEHDAIIRAFQRHVPGCYVRDYREQGGYIVIAKDFKTLKWGDQTTTQKRYVSVPATTLVNLPRGQVGALTRFVGVRHDRPGWRQEFRRASLHLSREQMEGITDELGMGEVFMGVVPAPDGDN